MTMFHTIWTVALFAIFVAIIVWAWSGKRRDDFSDAASIPFNENANVHKPRESEDVNHD